MFSTSRRTPRAATSPPSYRAYKRGAFFANPCYTQIHPTCIPVSGEYQSKLTLMSESLRNDGRVWVLEKERRQAPAGRDPGGGARLLSRAEISELSAISRRATSPRAPRKKRATTAAASAPAGSAFISILRDAHQAPRREPTIRERYGNLFDMYHQITGENAYQSRCASIPPCITRWAGCGWTTT